MRLGRTARLAAAVLTGGVLAAAAGCSGRAVRGRHVLWVGARVQDTDGGPGQRGASGRGVAHLRA